MVHLDILTPRTWYAKRNAATSRFLTYLELSVWISYYIFWGVKTVPCLIYHLNMKLPPSKCIGSLNFV